MKARFTPSLFAHAEAVLGQLLQFQFPADAVVSHYFRDHRALGHADRAFVAETVFAVLRRGRSIEARCAGQLSDRRRLLVALAVTRNWSQRELAPVLKASEEEWLAAAKSMPESEFSPAVRCDLPERREIRGMRRRVKGGAQRVGEGHGVSLLVSLTARPMAPARSPATVNRATTAPHTPAHRSHAPTHAPPLELGDVEAFADLPDDARDTFATAASQVHLSAGQEVADFALAYIVAGEVDVAPRDIPVIATHLATGAVLRAQGTPTDAPPLRLVCTTKSAHIAVWSDEAVLAAFRSCPWVEDDLRSAADPVQALVGMSMGALGRRLDDMLRAQVGALLKVRSLLEGEIVAEAGAPVPGLVVVGAGRLELFDHDAVVGELLPGEFLFADQVLGAGAAPYGARAGAGGALVLAGNRAVAQELMVTCPPLLEILAGM